MSRCAVFLLICLQAVELSRPPKLGLVFWNVGQGSWTSLVLERSCIHVDMGGTRWSAPVLRTHCGGKNNFLFLTHYDLDHLNLVSKVRSILPRLCLAHRDPLKGKIQKKISKLPPLPNCPASPLQLEWVRRSAFQRNNDSHVFLMLKKLLITGDSPAHLEKNLGAHLKHTSVEYLAVGHHGSHTSSSKELLRALPALRMAVVSAEKRRYGHPHRQTESRYKEAHVPLLGTEEFGTIFVEDVTL